ncbi:MAG: hypothetical protein PVF49_13455 [Anaerolineales bacterium]|jgi:hypothetical protein
MNILHITDSDFSDRDWQAYYTLLETLHERFHSRFARVGWEQTKERFLSLADADPNYRRFIIFDGQTAVGWADFNVLAASTSAQTFNAILEPIYDEAPAEFERIVADEFLRLMEEHRAGSVHIMAATQRVAAIARRWHACALNRLDTFRLLRAKAQTARMRSWLETYPKENPSLRLEFFSPVPEEHLAAHTESLVRYIAEMPTERESITEFRYTVEEARRDSEWRQKNRIHIYTFALFDSTGTMIGNSNAVINESDPTDVYQAMTGVDKEYRGRGLSRWLKAALFFKVGEDFPANETMTTDMRAANAPIQKVNAEMGYILLHSGHEFDLTAEGLRDFLNH